MARSLAEIRSMSKELSKQINKQDLLASIMADKNTNADDNTLKEINKKLQDLTQNIAVMHQEALT